MNSAKIAFGRELLDFRLDVNISWRALWSSPVFDWRGRVRLVQ
jgi:hypothetical protein